MTKNAQATRNGPSKQLRITSLVSAKQKKQATRMARDLTDGNVGELVRQLLAKRFEAYTKKKSSASTKSTKASPRNLVSGAHVSPAKPGRKRSARDSAANGAKRSTAKNSRKGRAVPAVGKRGGNRTRTTTKSR